MIHAEGDFQAPPGHSEHHQRQGEIADRLLFLWTKLQTAQLWETGKCMPGTGDCLMSFVPSKERGRQQMNLPEGENNSTVPRRQVFRGLCTLLVSALVTPVLADREEGRGLRNQDGTTQSLKGHQQHPTLIPASDATYVVHGPAGCIGQHPIPSR